MPETKQVKQYGWWNSPKKGTPDAEKLPSSWVARITGTERTDKGYDRLVREFISESSLEWQGSKTEKWPRGVKLWLLNDGLYEVRTFASQKHAEVGDEGGERFFAQVKDSVLRKIDRGELDKLLVEQIALSKGEAVHTGDGEVEQ